MHIMTGIVFKTLCQCIVKVRGSFIQGLYSFHTFGCVTGWNDRSAIILLCLRVLSIHMEKVIIITRKITYIRDLFTIYNYYLPQIKVDSIYYTSYDLDCLSIIKPNTVNTIN